jgi:hypothetical protein
VFDKLGNNNPVLETQKKIQKHFSNENDSSPKLMARVSIQDYKPFSKSGLDEIKDSNSTADDLEFKKPSSINIEKELDSKKIKQKSNNFLSSSVSSIDTSTSIRSASTFNKNPDDDISEIDKRIQALQTYLDNARLIIISTTQKDFYFIFFILEELEYY